MKTSFSRLVRMIALMLAVLAIASCALTACTTPGKNPEGSSTPTQNEGNKPNDNEGNNGDNTGDNNNNNNDNNDEKYEVITIAEALELCGEEGNITTERYYIRGTIVTIKNAQYGQMVIEDETGSIEVYGTYSADGEKTYPELEYSPVKGDEVLLHCILQNYGGTKEVKNARLIEYKNNQGNIDVSAYTPATIKEARNAAKGANLKVKGVVARITFANGMKPNGFILIGDGASIYVYDMDAAQRVKIGNTVEIAGTKDYWILDKEQESAAKFNYKGCNQLTDAILVSNDEKETAFDTSSIKETTIKELLEVPFSEDNTTAVYKVTALVSKVPGDGFVNYYFNDLDGTTGTYTYTQCNGGDFAWLDEFDGKICTVYITALNAKSSTAGCVYRFLPIAVYDEGFKFDTNNAPEFAVKYFGVDQFKATYTGDPALELVTNVSSDLLGFKDATLSYTSSNTSVITIATAGDKTVMNCLANGTSDVTITGSYNGKTFSKTVTITVSLPTEEIPSISITDAIAAENGTVVTVKGIVGPSLVNQKGGFYLITNNGVIAVRTTQDALSLLTIGDEIVVKGTKKLSKDSDGNICIDSAEILQNYYGNHQYSTESFITGKTLADVMALDGNVSHTVEVYVITGTIVREKTNYSTNTYVVDGDKKFMLYAGGAGQYAWLENYVGQTLTIELAVCDWNAKGNRGCVLSVTTADGTKVINNLNFAQ